MSEVGIFEVIHAMRVNHLQVLVRDGHYILVDEPVDAFREGRSS
jgi:hypothetical protein